VILTPSASIATVSDISPETANPDADLAPGLRTDAGETPALTRLGIAVEAVTIGTIVDAPPIEDGAARPVAKATIVGTIADTTIVERAVAAIAMREAVMSGATMIDVREAMIGEGLPSVEEALARLLVAEAHLLRMKEGDPDLVIPVSNYCQHFDEI
jgi:hypothetical protein